MPRVGADVGAGADSIDDIVRLRHGGMDRFFTGVRARFSITALMKRPVLKAISGIKESAWTPIYHPNTIWDDDEQRLVSDAQIAEAPSPCSPAGAEPTRWTAGRSCAGFGCGASSSSADSIGCQNN